MSLAIKNLHKSFGKQVIFNDLNFDFSTSGFYVLSGPSGSGKTTLLNILAGYEPFDEGNRDIAKEVQIACIFQNFELIESITVKENIELYEKLHACICEEKEMILEQLGLMPLLNHYPNECSQGQKQRVGIARALMMNPQIILCDEPTESLDQDNKKKVMELLVALSKHKVVIVATHEVAMIKEYHPIIYTLKDHQLYGELHVGNVVTYSKLNQSVDEKRLKKILKNMLHKK